MKRSVSSLFLVLAAAGCGRGSGGSPTCGLALLAGPSLITLYLVHARGARGPSRDRPHYRRQQGSEPVRCACRLGQRQQSPLSVVRWFRFAANVVTKAHPVAVTAPRRIVDGRERVTLNTTYVRALESAG